MSFSSESVAGPMNRILRRTSLMKISIDFSPLIKILPVILHKTVIMFLFSGLDLI